VRIRRAPVILAGALALAMVAAACGQEPTTSEGGGPPTIEEGVLTVGSCLDYPPFESVEAGDETGFDVDLAEEIAARLGLEVQWVRIDFDSIFTAVAGGQFDMAAAAITATGETGQERDQTVDFSDHYYNSRQSLVVNIEQTPDIATLDDLQPGDIVGVQKGTTGKAYAEENAPEGVEIKTFTAAPDAFRDLEAGNITAIVNDEPSSAAIIEDLPSLELVEAIDTNEKYAFAFAPETDELTDAVNGALEEIIADGTYEDLYGEYFPGAEVPPEFQASE
jgi:ABC-type amino acid transport substrate-binding protein